jgi:hypothetical protein
MNNHGTKKLLLALITASAALQAAPPLTSIQDTLYKADGTLFSGSVTISWKSFVAADASSIPMNMITVQINSGILRLRLVPTTTASAGAYYLARFNAEGKTQFSEIWSVPASETPLQVKDVRVASAPAGGGGSGSVPSTILLSDVQGLNEALADRPTKAAGFAAGRTLMADLNGELAAVLGAASDCVRVDGTAGPCGTTPTQIAFVDGETPAGAVDGVNRVFLLSQIPSPASSVHFFRNGILQKAAVDYALSGNTVTFEVNSTPQTGDVLSVSYRTVAP